MPHKLKLLLAAAAATLLLAGMSETSGATPAQRLVPSLAIAATVSVPSQFGILGVASGDGAVWATDGTATLTRVDPENQHVVASIPVRDASLVGAGAGNVWVVGSNSIATRIDPQTNTVVATVPVARDPVAVGAGAVWAVSNETPIVWRINAARNKIVAAIDLTDTPNGLAATPNGVWILGATNNRVVRIDPSKNRVRSVISIPKRDGYLGRGGAITADANSVWVATLTHLIRLDPRTGRILAAVAIETHPSQDPVRLTAVSSGSAGVWVGDGDDATIVQIAVP